MLCYSEMPRSYHVFHTRLGKDIVPGLGLWHCKEELCTEGLSAVCPAQVRSVGSHTSCSMWAGLNLWCSVSYMVAILIVIIKVVPSVTCEGFVSNPCDSNICCFHFFFPYFHTYCIDFSCATAVGTFNPQTSGARCSPLAMEH